MKRVILLKTDGTKAVITPEKKPSLEQMQQWVGGFIEPLKVRYEGKAATLVVNDEGRLKNLPGNQQATELYGYPIVGNAFILEGWRL